MVEAERSIEELAEKDVNRDKQTCVCNMEWRTNGVGEEWDDCVCTPEEKNKDKATK